MNTGRRWMAAGILAAALAADAGCGTVVDLCSEQRIYGGVRRDVQAVSSLGSAEPAELVGIAAVAAVAPIAAPGVLEIIDIPFSFIMDTYFLPLTLLMHLFR